MGYNSAQNFPGPSTSVWAKVATRSYHPCTNGGVEHVNHIMALILAMVGGEQQSDWDIHLQHVESAYNNSISPTLVDTKASTNLPT